MKCKIVKRFLPEYLENSLSQKQTLAVSEHLSSCRDCRAAEHDLKAQVDALSCSFKRAGDSCPDFPELSSRVVFALRKPFSPTARLGWSLRPALVDSISLVPLVLATALAAVLFFQGMLSSSSQYAPELRSGRQQAFSARPRSDGLVDSGIITRRFARIQTPESGWRR